MKEKQTSKSNTKKIRTIIVSIFLAVIVWLMVVYVNDPDITTTLTDIKVTYVGMGELRDNNLVLTGKNAVPPISIIVTGKRSDLMNFMDDISVQLDVSSITEAGEYNIKGKLYMPTTRITVEKEKFSEIPVTVENLEQKEIEVSVKQTGVLKDKIVKSVLTNPKVLISGAKSEIDSVASAEASIDISHLKGDDVEHASYVLLNSSGELISKNETIESTSRDVEITNTVYTKKALTVVPVLSNELEKDYMLETDNTEVSPSSIVVGVEDTNTDDKLVVSINKISDDVEEYEIVTPNGMYIPEENKRVKIKADIVRKTAGEAQVNVTAENVGEGLTAKIEDKLGVEVWSAKDDISPNDIKATVDAAGLGEGTYTLPVKLSGDGMEFRGNYTAYVKIEKQ